MTTENPETENQQSPFFDTKLECQVLRLIIIDDRNANAEVKQSATTNVGYLLTAGITKEIFTTPFRQWLFEIIVANYVTHSETLARSLLHFKFKKAYKDLEEIKKHVILLDRILACEFQSHNFKPLVEELKNLYNYRKLVELNFTLNNTLKQHAEEPGKSIDLARVTETSISKLLVASDRFRIIEEDAFKDIDKDIADIKDRRANPEKYKGIPTGIEPVDRATGGWLPGELSVVLGRPSMGKSILLLGFAYHAFMQRYNVIYVTIEMPIEQQKRRLQCRAVGVVPYKKFKMPHLLTDGEVDIIEKRLKKLKESQVSYFWFIDAPQHSNAAFLESRILAFEGAIGKKVELIIVDPIYLMKPNDPKTDDPVGSVSWDLKLLARTLNVPVIGASQFNREGGKRHQHGKEVDTMDAAFSDKLGNNTDNMMGITGDKKNAKLAFPKSRDSSVDVVFLEKEFDYMRFKYDPTKTEDADSNE